MDFSKEELDQRAQKIQIEVSYVHTYSFASYTFICQIYVYRNLNLWNSSIEV